MNYQYFEYYYLLYYNKMDIINIFTILLLTKVKQNNKIIMLSKYNKNIATKYLWKLLFVRDNRINNFVESYYDKTNSF